MQEENWESRNKKKRYNWQALLKTTRNINMSHRKERAGKLLNNKGRLVINRISKNAELFSEYLASVFTNNVFDSD